MSKRSHEFFLVGTTAQMARSPHDPEFGIADYRNNKSRRMIEKFLKVSAEVNSQDFREDPAGGGIAERKSGTEIREMNCETSGSGNQKPKASNKRRNEK
jgi:hypothetical protein